MPIDRSSEQRRGDRRRRLTIAVAVVNDPGREADRRIRQSVERLRTRPHHLRVGAPLREQDVQLLVCAPFLRRETGWRRIAALERLGDIGWNRAQES